jgi:WD40 repeat protein
VLAVRKGFDRLKPFLERLEKDPKDGEAALKVGEYYALLKGNWKAALPLLARGSDEGLKAQAHKDQAAPKEGKDQLAVADGWWDLAEKYKGAAQTHLLQRARHWYEQAAQGLTGLSRTKALKRIDRVTELTQGTPVVAKAGPVGAIRTFQGHTAEVKGVAFSPDGRYGVSGGKDDTARLWDLNTGKEIRPFRGHTKEVWSVAYHPNGRQLFTASWDATVRLWDTNTGKDVRTFTHPLDVNSVAVTPDGKWMLTGCDDKHMRLWDLSTNQEVRRFAGHDNYVYGVAFSPNGQYVASGSADKTVRVYERGTAKLVRAIAGQTADTYYVAFSRDNRFVFSCGDSAAHMWEIATGKEARKFEAGGMSGYVKGMALSPDGRRLLTGHEDKLLRLWDVDTGKEIQRFEGHTDTVNCVSFSADGMRALSGGQDRTVRLWGLPSR